MTASNAARQAWVEMHEAAMRKAATEALAASNRWRRLNAEIMVKAAAEGWDYLTIARSKSQSLPLADEYGSYSFFAGKAQFHAAVLQGALAAEQLLGGTDLTGLAYERDDEPVARPVPARVDGFSVGGGARKKKNSSPAGPVVDTVERRTHQSGPAGVERGAAELGGSAAPAPAGGAR